MLHIVDRGTLGLTSGMGIGYFASTLEDNDMLLDVPPECVLLAELDCAVFQDKSFTTNAEEALQMMASHRNGVVIVRRC